MIYELYTSALQASPAAGAVISVALMLFVGFAATRLTRLIKLPDVTAYIFAGMLIGPQCLGIIPASVVDGMDFIPDIALAFIAFGVGKYFRLESLRRSGAKVLVIALIEATLASALVFVLTYFALGLPFTVSVLLAALASATAPTSTVMTIRQTGAKGDFVDSLLQLMALDDVIGLLAYGVAVSLAVVSQTPGAFADAGTVLLPVAVNIGVLLLGCLFGLLLKLLFRGRSTDNRLIVSVATLFAFCGICTVLDVSPLLGCMSMGMTYINSTGDEKLFKQLNYFSPPLLLLFFVRSGIVFRFDALTGVSGDGVSLLPAVLVYAAARFAGKYIGCFVGCVAVRKPDSHRKYLGLALLPQASVTIGLAALGARALGGLAGDSLQTVILAAALLYETVGPACAKLALYLSGSYPTTIEELTDISPVGADEAPKSEAELLIQRIQAIQATLPEHIPPGDADEEAFNEGAEQLDAGYSRQNRFRRRR